MYYNKPLDKVVYVKERFGGEEGEEKEIKT